MTTVNTNRTGYGWTILGVVVLLALAIIFWKPASRFMSRSSKNTAIIADSLAAKQCDGTTDKVTFNMTGDEIRQIIERVSALDAENKMLKAQLEDCCGKKKPAKSTTNRSKSTTTRSKPATTQTTQRTTSTPAVSQSSRSGAVNLAILEYESYESGDVGAAFDNETSELYYFLAVDIPNQFPRTGIDTYLNSKSGRAGQIYGNYIRYYTGTFVTVDMLDHVWSWAIYIGDHTSYGFDMWLPTEIVKSFKQQNPDPNVIRTNGTIVGDQPGYEYYGKITNYTSKRVR